MAPEPLPQRPERRLEAKDVEALTQWLDWAFAETKMQLAKAA